MISVVIPTYNRGARLPTALDSVLIQDCGHDVELIVVDDGSSDETEALVAGRYPDVHYLWQQNKGVSAARNAGIKYARGDWIALLDSDDYWLPGKLTAQLDVLRATTLKVVHTDEIWIRNGVRVNAMRKHQKQGGWIYSKCLPLCVVSPSSIMIHRSIFDDIGLFDEALPACEDYDLWLRLCARYELAYLDTPFLVKVGGHADQLSRRYWGMDRYRVRALEKALGSGCLDESQFDMTKAMCQKKLTILIEGAQKHQNKSLLLDCQRKLERLADMTFQGE